MAEDYTSTLTKKNVSAANRPSNRFTKATSTVTARLSKVMARLGHLLAATTATAAATLAGSGSDFAQLMESQARSAFFELRPKVEPPSEIVILAIDNPSIANPGLYYQTDPKTYQGLEPLKSFPYKREAYARAIDKLIAAGARAVAVNVVFDTPSTYGQQDDQALKKSLMRNGSKVSLAALYDVSVSRNAYKIVQLRQPDEKFRVGSVVIGTSNFPLEVDGNIHLFGSEFNKIITEDGILSSKMPDFAEATLQAAGVNYPQPKGNGIYYHGSVDTFKQFSFWEIFDSQLWNANLQQGKVFKDKIVLIGATTTNLNDFHPVPISQGWFAPKKMAGVEIQANAIATLMSGRALTPLIPNLLARGISVLVLVGGCAVLISRTKGGFQRFFTSLCLAGTWFGIGYVSFVYSSLILPVTIPVLAISGVGLCYLSAEATREMLRKTQLVKIFQKYSTDRVVQEILSQQDDLKDLLQQREMAISGKVLDGRYKIVKVLGSGGFSETYIAEDTRRPGNPLCVVKQLKPANAKAEGMEIARRLFTSEAQTLEKLGIHSQIPQLLAYFEEEEEFYLVQEYIVGRPLSQELSSGKRLSEAAVVNILRDLLQTLVFVHDNEVIHRDIKPSNIIRRESDRKLVLIDFGAVKQVTTQILDNTEQTAFTIGIGTRGYAPPEQCVGRPHYSSDIYAVGMIGIKALTGIPPHDMARDEHGELTWTHQAKVSNSLAQILSKMVLDNWKQRYKSAREALAALETLANPSELNSTEEILPTDDFDFDDSDTPTTPWSVETEQTPPSSLSNVSSPLEDVEMPRKK